MSLVTDTEPALIALDWGTSGQRAWLLGADGGILAARSAGRGLLTTTEDVDLDDPRAREAAYESAFRKTCGDWLTEVPGLPALAAGMVGSAQGWADSGYRTVPASLDFPSLVPVSHRGGVLHLVPGLRIPSGAHPGDVIRGEETQLVGVLETLGGPGGPLTVVLPGTHSKWVRVEDGIVTGFTTAMTGELYGLLITHGILARTAADPVADDEAFSRGLAAGRRSRGLATEAFGARPLVLDGVLKPASLPDYLSGVLIADEVSHLLRDNDTRVVLCGADELCRRYATALADRGVEATVLSEEVTTRGLWRIATAAGLLEDRLERTLKP
ncbi:2-dehydro-3-deoxygalactonokinase [Amycolatopsis keratiniphila]|uniref:2-dehydro-3-deoxygalactonokinase n=1 Tax=Amycolatopsis keratiniphila TaxID=129921 RepID=UPI00087C6FEB|nr:2-dehydro-3-deoxygalactonokinase [Amycolatopsis keratiniphila]OLZ43784.1 2-keto-3-deoxy-galactonokinase [Amycolatopsis keratiniphila subsp. nogabecina]SDU02033.1 2-keto-3-deoxygalactonate kinase [Amycolatopsis keratiniphila]